MRLGEAPSEPTAELVALVEDVMGAGAVHWHKPHTGLSPAQRFVVRFDNGDSCFVKAAVDDDTRQQLRTEHRMLTTLDRLVPSVRAWTDDVLIVEDLSDAHWPADHVPVRWNEGQIEALLEALPVAEALPELPGLSFEPEWPRLADAGVRDLPIDDLVAIEAQLDLSGDALVHNDVRSDNVCFRDNDVVLVDWSDPRRGPDWYDRATLALTLPLETDRNASTIAPDAAPFAAWQAGVLTRRAREPGVPAWLVDVFRRMTANALEMAGL